MSLQRLIIDTPLTANGFKSVCPFGTATKTASIQSFENYIAAVSSGLQSARLSFLVGAVAASATFTFSSTGPTNTQTCSILNVTFTAVTSGATGNQFNISATPATVAANLAASINASASLAGKVTAVALLGVVTITSVVPGSIGNGLSVSAGTLSNTVVAQFASGADGTSTVMNFL